MAAIVQYDQFLTPYASDGNPQTGLTLFNEEYIRPLPFGNVWTKLRIGVCLTMDHPSFFPTCPGLVDIGVCSGTVLGIGSGNPVNYMGVGWGASNVLGRLNNPNPPRIEYKTGDTTGGWPYSGFYVSDAGSQYALSQYGTTVPEFIWSRSQGAVYMWVPVTAPFNTVRRRAFVVVDLWRVSTQIFKAYLYYDNDNVYCDVPQRSTLAAMESPFAVTPLLNMPAWNFQTNAMVNLSMANRISSTDIDYLDSAGPLDSLNIAWNLSSFGMTIYHIMVAKFA